MSESVVAIVPAKMTSRRLPKKNMALLRGRPLLWYTLIAAKQSRQIDEVIVSSESQEILDYAREMGVGAHARAPELSAASVRNDEVVRNVLADSAWADTPPDYVVLLQPTHPLRRTAELDAGIECLKARPDGDCLFTVVADDSLVGRIDADQRFVPHVPLPRNKARETRRYRNTGSFYVFRTERTFAQGRMFGQSIVPFELAHPEYEIDIDHGCDLVVADAMLASYPQDFPQFTGTVRA